MSVGYRKKENYKVSIDNSCVCRPKSANDGDYRYCSFPAIRILSAQAFGRGTGAENNVCVASESVHGRRTPDSETRRVTNMYAPDGRGKPVLAIHSLSSLGHRRVGAHDIVHSSPRKSKPITRVHQVVLHMMDFQRIPVSVLAKLDLGVDNVVGPFVKQTSTSVGDGGGQRQRCRWEQPSKECAGGCHPSNHERTGINADLQIRLVMMLLVNVFAIPGDFGMQHMLMEHVFLKAPKEYGCERQQTF